MHKRRQRFAKQLLDTRNKKTIDLYNSDSILDFFEEIAYLVKRGVLDEGMV
jgi:hypothetical protein